MRAAGEWTPCSPDGSRTVLVATILGSSLAFLDGTIVNVALPVLQERLRATVAGAQWIVEAYALFLSSLVLVGGSLGDRYGRRRIFTLGTAVFAAGSLACGLAPDIRALVAARAVQGVGAALLVPSSLALLGAAFPESARGRALGTWSAWTSITAAIGPAAGGWLVQAASWRSVFFVNLPLAAAVLVVSRRIPESRKESAGAIDVAGAILASVGLAGVVFGLIEAPAAGWKSGRVGLPLGLGIAALVAFAAVERRIGNPMVPPALLRIRAFVAANLLTFFLYAALSGLLFFLPFDLIRARGYSPAAAGASLLPFVLLVFALSPAAGRISDKTGPRIPLAIGPATAAAGFFLLASLPKDSSYAASVLPGLALLGVGMAITIPPLTATVLNAVGRSDAGIASGTNNAVARVASLLAVAVFGIVVTAAFGSALERRLGATAPGAESRQIAAAEESRLGAMPSSEAPRSSEDAAKGRAIRDSLHASFRVVGVLSGALALLAAACGALGIEPKKRHAPPA